MTNPVLNITIRATKAGVLESPRHIKAKRSDSLGSITIGATGGVGVVTFTVEDKPDWDIRRDNQLISVNAALYSIHPQVPPYPLMKSKYTFRATDSATPNANTALVELVVESEPEDGFTYLPRSKGWPQMIVEDRIWQLLDHKQVPLPNTGDRNRSVTWHLRRNANDHRIMLYYNYSYGVGPAKREARTVKIYEASELTERTMCAELASLGCAEHELAPVWQGLLDHLPGFVQT